MSPDLTHADAAELLGAFALDALDADEAAAVRRHLVSCPRCRDEFAQYREVAALLANAGTRAPDGVWERITAELEEPPPGLRLEALRRAQPRWVRAGGILAVAASIVVAVLGVEVRHLDHRVAALQRPLQASGVQQAALAAVVDPTARQVELKSTTTADRVQVVLLADGQAYVLRAALPVLPASETYQLWGLVGGRTKVSLGLLGPRPGATAFRLDPAQMSLLAITAEPAGGVVSTNQPAVVWGALPPPS